MSASDYPVTFAYGATDGQFYGPNGSIGPYHRGDDHYMPVGTPVLVNGVKIGLSGATGSVSGPHLHVGRFVNGKDTNPNGGGFILKAPVTVFDTGYDSVDGNYVRLNDGDGALWVYLHLSVNNLVKKGQILEGVSMPNATEANNYWRKYLGRDLTVAQIAYYTAHSWLTLAEDTLQSLKRESDITIHNLQLPATKLAPGRYEV